MRKQHIKLLERVNKYGAFSDDQIKVLSREDVPLNILNLVFNYFYNQNRNGIDMAASAKEAENWIDYCIQEKEKRQLNSDDVLYIMRHILPAHKDKDTLIANDKKLYIYRVYLYAAKHEANTALCGLYTYCLYQGMEHKEMRLLLKMALSNKICWDLKFLFECYPCLLDDYEHNNKNSLVIELIRRGIVALFRPKENILEGLYDLQTHKFSFKNSEFEKYFRIYSNYNREWVENKIAIAEMQRDNYPIVEEIIKFCKTNKMKSDEYMDSDLSKRWYCWQLLDPTKEEQMAQCFKILGQPFKIDTGAWSLSVSSSTTFFTSIVYNEYSYVTADGNKTRGGWRAEKASNTIRLLVTPDGKLFRAFDSKKKKNIPVSIKEFLYFRGKPNLFGELVETIFEFHRKGNSFFADVIQDCEKCGCLIPMSFNDMIGHRDRSHYLNEKYKLANEIGVDWNKRNINLSYLIIKAYPLVEKGESQNILIKQRSIALLKDCTYVTKSNDRVYTFLMSIINHNIMKQEQAINAEDIRSRYRQKAIELMPEDVLKDELKTWMDEMASNELYGNQCSSTLVLDYVTKCRKLKSKIHLDVCSVTQLGCTRSMSVGYKMMVGEIEIPKESKFLHLRQILPQKFEWVQTKNRLLLEAELQHNDIWSISNKIASDKRAIYSFVDKEGEFADDRKPQRYTIAFICGRNQKYKIDQIYAEYNNVNNEKLTNHIQSILDEHQNIGNKK